MAPANQDSSLAEEPMTNEDGSLRRHFISNRLGDGVEKQLIAMLGPDVYDEMYEHITSYQRKKLILKRQDTGKPLTKWNQKRIENIEATLQVYGGKCFFCPTDMTEEGLKLFIPMEMHYNYDNKNDKCTKLRIAGYPREIEGRPVVLVCGVCSHKPKIAAFLNWVLWKKTTAPEGGWQSYTRRHYYQNEERYPNQHTKGNEKPKESRVVKGI